MVQARSRHINRGIVCAMYNLGCRGSSAETLYHVHSRPRQGLAENACIVPLLILDLSPLGHPASNDVVSIIYPALGCGVARSKQTAMRWMRTAADTGDPNACGDLANWMYADRPYARDVGRVGEAAGIAASAGIMEGHDVPPDVLTGVVHWMRKGGDDTVAALEEIRTEAMHGALYCWREGCEVVGHLKDFKVCPQCKTARYCGDECQKVDWTTGGHNHKCGTLAAYNNEQYSEEKDYINRAT